MAVTTKVIVIGAGLSGLTAAKVLNDNGIEVIVLEADSRVGGRLLSVQTDAYGWLDLGGQYVGPTQDHLLTLAKELGIETRDVGHRGSGILYRRGKVSRFEGTFPPMSSPSDQIENDFLWQKTQQLCEKLRLNEPWRVEDALTLDRMTYKEWVENLVKSKEVHANAKTLLRVNMTSEPHEVSLLWTLWFIKNAGGVNMMNSIHGGAQEKSFVKGAQQLPLELAEKLRGKVFTSKPVTKICQSSDDIRVYTSSGDEYKAKFVIIAMAPTIQSKISYEPALPPLRAQLLQRTPQASVMKTITYYDRPYWKEKGLSGYTFVEDDHPDFPVSSTLDDSKSDPQISSLVGFIGGEPARLMSRLTSSERGKKVAKQYATMFGIPEMAEPIHYEDKNWSEEEWCGGGYTAFMGPGVLTSFGSVIRTPVGRIHFAGTESATKWSGYMDGAVQAGERASNEVIDCLGKSKRVVEKYQYSKV